MAKRAEESDRPFSALDKGTVRDVLRHDGRSSTAATTQTAPPAPEPPPAVAPAPRAMQPPETRYRVHKQTKSRRTMFHPEEDRAIEDAILRLRRAADVRITWVNLSRALVRLLLDSEAAVVDEARKVPDLERPNNGDLRGLEEMEARLARLIGRAIQQDDPIRNV